MAAVRTAIEFEIDRKWDRIKHLLKRHRDQDAAAECRQVLSLVLAEWLELLETTRDGRRKQVTGQDLLDEVAYLARASDARRVPVTDSEQQPGTGSGTTREERTALANASMRKMERQYLKGL